MFLSMLFPLQMELYLYKVLLNGIKMNVMFFFSYSNPDPIDIIK